MLVAMTVNVYSSFRYISPKRHDPVKYAQYFAQNDDLDDLDDVIIDDVILNSKATEEIPMVTRQV
jgi:hypothetical protein